MSVAGAGGGRKAAVSGGLLAALPAFPDYRRHLHAPRTLQICCADGAATKLLLLLLHVLPRWAAVVHRPAALLLLRLLLQRLQRARTTADARARQVSRCGRVRVCTLLFLCLLGPPRAARIRGPGPRLWQLLLLWDLQRIWQQ